MLMNFGRTVQFKRLVAGDPENSLRHLRLAAPNGN
jgi:hypothetical protein